MSKGLKTTEIRNRPYIDIEIDIEVTVRRREREREHILISVFFSYIPARVGRGTQVTRT